MKQFNFKTFQDLTGTIRKNIRKLPTDVDLIVGIPRSGMIPAYMIALFLNKPVCSLDEYILGITPHSGVRPLGNVTQEDDHKILMVDDSICYGRSLNKVKTRLLTADTRNDVIFYCVVYACEESKMLVDYYLEVLPLPRIFQWNYMNHYMNSNSCFDIDGVLCVDPEPWQNDDGEKYIDFLLNAKPLYIPAYPIKALVTSRLEKYRPQTEYWLNKHNVKYEELYMLDLPSKAERIRSKAHASFKADIYKKLGNTELFVESNVDQAKEISMLAQKPVVCVETDEFFYPAMDETTEILKKKQVSLEKKRVLLCSHELTYTGALHSLLRICRVLIKNGAYVELWSREDGEFRREFESIIVFVQIVPNEEILTEETQERIKTFDLVIVNTVLAHKFFLAARNYVPTIWYIREAQYISEISDHVKDRYEALKTADELYCVSEYAQEYIKKNYNPNVRVVHNCVEDYYKGKSSIVRKTINFAIVGTLTYQKAFDVVIDAFESLSSEMQSKGHLYLAGRLIDHRKDYWQPILDRVNHNENMTYMGEIKNTQEKMDFFEKIHVFVVVSRDESCSLVVLESVMMGKPVIISENVGAKYVINPDCGWVVETGSVDFLKAVFEEIIKNPNRLEQMGKIARKRYEETSTIGLYEKNIMEMVLKKLEQSVKPEYRNQSVTSLAYQFELRHASQKKMEEELLETKKMYDNMRKSVSYKIGRIITFIPRKIRRMRKIVSSFASEKRIW